MTAPPLLAIPHDASADVEVARTWATRVLTARDGTERRLASAVRPQVALRYQLTPVTADELQQLAATLALAASAAGSARGLVRVPRWEDKALLAAPAAVGAHQLALFLAAGDDARHRAFRDAGEVALWADGRPMRTVALAGANAVAADALALAAPLDGAACALADGTPRPWPAGTAVVPVARARLAPDLDGTQVTEVAATGTVALTMEPDAPLAGAAPWLPGDAGTAQAPAVATLAVVDEHGTTSGYCGPGGQRRLRAVCRDALGAVVPAPAALVWASATPSQVRVTVPPGDGAAAVVECLVGGGASASSTDVTATLPAAATVDGVARVATYVVGWS